MDRLCSLCGEQLGYETLRFSLTPGRETGAPGPLCELCERVPPPFRHAAAYGVYEETLRALIHLLKYEQIRPVAAPLGRLLATAIENLRDLPDPVTVVVVPLHRAKAAERGFNQTELLAQHAIRACAQAHPERRLHPALQALERKRNTESQSGLTRHQRRRNLRGAFLVAQPRQIEGRAVLLLDDIYTTGATARECSRTLLRAGATSVHVATLARSQREGIAFWDRPSQSRGLQTSVEAQASLPHRTPDPAATQG